MGLTKYIWNSQTNTHKELILAQIPIQTVFRIQNDVIGVAYKGGIIKIFNTTTLKNTGDCFHEELEDLINIKNGKFVSYSPSTIKLWDLSTDTYKCQVFTNANKFKAILDILNDH